MNPTIDKIIRAVLTPLSYIYGGVMWLRNKLFDNGIFKEVGFDVPVIGVGNITVGGTGKTPHVEYIVSALSPYYKIAVLSRGYKRATKGFVLANNTSTPEQLGDESLQIFQKFGNTVKVAVCESRRKGINKLLEIFPDINLIVLDDSFQHRWVKPKVSVLLMDYNRLVVNDKLLPLGRLRESANERYRAENIIVTKCDPLSPPIDFRVCIRKLEPMSFQRIYFSTYQYKGLEPVFPDDSPYSASLSSLTSNDAALLICGIANPRDFIRHLNQYSLSTHIMHFSDHHNFTRKDVENIKLRFEEMKGLKKLIVTTEKDAIRLRYNPYFPNELKPFVFYLPISVKMLQGVEAKDFIEDLRAEIARNDTPTHYSSLMGDKN